MLEILGTFWPFIGLPCSVFLALLVKPVFWRWLALIVLPAAVIVIHERFVLPFCLPNGNLLAAVIFGLMLVVAAIYFPAIIIAAVVSGVRYFSQRDSNSIGPDEG